MANIIALSIDYNVYLMIIARLYVLIVGIYVHIYL